MRDQSDSLRCPVCGKGVFIDVAYEEPRGESADPRLVSDSHEVLVYSCGHEVAGLPVATADAERMTVEERRSRETVAVPGPTPQPGPVPTPEPPPPEPGPVPPPEPPAPEPGRPPTPPPDSEPPIRGRGGQSGTGSPRR